LKRSEIIWWALSSESEGEETPKPLISKKEKAKKEKLGVEVYT